MRAHSELGRERRGRLAAARLYLVCDATPGGRDLRSLLPAAVAGGVDIVQLRDKLLGDEELAELAREIGALCGRLGVLFILNDRPAIACEVGADGVHVGQEDMSVVRARELLGADMLVGLSTHAPAEIDAIEPAGWTCGEGADSRSTRDTFRGVDYIGVGPVYATPTKPGRAAVGLELVRYAATHAGVPFYAIGGIHAGNSAAVIAAGARRVAVVRAIAESSDPERAARELQATLDGVNESTCFRVPAA